MEKRSRPEEALAYPPLENDVIEYLRGINELSCGGTGRKWTKFVSRKLRRALCRVDGGYIQYTAFNTFA